MQDLKLQLVRFEGDYENFDVDFRGDAFKGEADGDRHKTIAEWANVPAERVGDVLAICERLNMAASHYFDILSAAAEDLGGMNLRLADAVLDAAGLPGDSVPIILFRLMDQ